MFGGAFSTTWAAQRQAEADELMHDKRRRDGMPDIRKDKYGRMPVEDDLWGSLFLETIKLDNSVRNSYGLNNPQGFHWLISIASLLPSWGIQGLKNELPNGHPLKLLKISEVGLGQELTEKINKISNNLIESNEELKINFSNLNFREKVVFSNFIFPIDVDFKNTKFFENVYFNDAVFCETADFEDAEFQGKKSHSKETAKFRNTTFKKIANFRNATFWGYANFKGAKLKGRAFFQEAKFKWHAPRFYDAVFNNEMTWSGIELPRFKKAPVDKHEKVDGEFIPISDKKIFISLSDRKTIKKNRKRRVEENQNSYENTSILLEKTKKYHDQHLFFREEMRCRRHLEKNIFICSAFGLYQVLADYGYGIGRAFGWWFAHILVGTAAIFITVFCIDMTLKEIIFCSISTSFANANPFVFIGFKESGVMACYPKLQTFSPVGFGYIRIIQAIVGIPLLFLLLTTLRVRFRLKTTNN